MEQDYPTRTRTGMSGRQPGRLDTCPICGQRFTNTDTDVKLALLTFQWRPYTRDSECQRIWYRIHEHCVTDYPGDCERKIAGLYINPGGLAICDDSHSGEYE